MRLHRLRITAFGPFPRTEDIDFDALSDAGLFLIRGRTGAGKTSVLDAVCFALYGQVPGVRNAVKGFRSDHAEPGLAPAVMLETTIRGRRLRVTRSPAWDRPKLRGTGTTTEKAKTLLEEFEDGAWTGLSTRNDEAGEVVQRLLGMNAAQFCQVALLPQGEFAGFLRSGAEERRKVLEKLFAAEAFAKAEKWLADHRAAAFRAVEDRAADVRSVADRIAEAAGTASPLDARGRVPAPRPADAEPVLDLAVLPGWAAGLAADLAAARDAARAAAAGADAVFEAARADLDAARALAEKQARRAAALARRAELETHAQYRSDLGARLDAAERAGRVLPHVRNEEERRHRATQAERRADETAARVAALLPPGASDDVLGKAEDTRRDEIAVLEGRRADAVRLREIAAERERIAREITDLTAAMERADAALAGLPDRIDARRAALVAAKEAAAALPGVRAAVQDAARRRDAARERDRVAARLAAARETHRDAVENAQRAKDHELALRQARLDGMAAVLAAELAAGEPCAVCGATEHPAPAVPTADLPDAAAVQDAQAAADRANAAREGAAARVEGLAAEHAALTDRAGDAPAADLDAALDAARRELADAERRAEHAALESALAADEDALARAHEARADHDRKLSERRARADDRAAEHARLRADLELARGDDPSLDARADRLRREADALRAAADAARDRAVARDELAAARAALRTALADEGFRTPDDVRAAALDDETAGNLRDRQRRFDAEAAVVARDLADPALRAAADAPAPDLAALETAFAVADAVRTAAASAADRAAHRCERIDTRRAELAAAIGAWRPAAAEHAVAARLAGLASGKDAANRWSMSLSAYVLAARLRQVVAAANERLGRMSSGRYVLDHTVEKAAGDRSKSGGGLGLRVLDAWTGRHRDPATLSGGESFITSLALALGLADVVTAEAGGTEINTLFVDEGFGTLDEDTLDEVMDVLDGLRDGGRAVGVVSHVVELRDRVPAQLHVRKERAGSTTAVHA
ncbi:AAA family ATPase [Actinomadura atramentaria]|uniref:AAA family ATPase n=1 Tax=Actinomadura atramentaria TaxID=1990 RepID=UPI0003729594|nr:SMC family ATPase [Actinomadura atramentaria]